MSRHAVVTGLILAVVFQVCVLAGMQVKAAMPLWTGAEVRVRTVPIDPRSLFRGNYAILRYDTAQAARGLLSESESLRRGMVVYVSLEPGDEGLHDWSLASLEPPVDGLYLRARVRFVSRQSERVPVGLTFPNIEAYFAPKAKALKLERELRSGGVAVLMVTPDGQAALKSVEAESGES